MQVEFPFRYFARRFTDWKSIFRPRSMFEILNRVLRTRSALWNVIELRLKNLFAKQQFIFPSSYCLENGPGSPCTSPWRWQESHGRMLPAVTGAWGILSGRAAPASPSSRRLPRKGGQQRGGVGASSSFPSHPPGLAAAPGPSSPLLVSFWGFSGTAAMTWSSRCSGLEEVAFACGFESSKAFRGKCPRRRSSMMACSVMWIYGWIADPSSNTAVQTVHYNMALTLCVPLSY